MKEFENENVEATEEANVETALAEVEAQFDSEDDEVIEDSKPWYTDPVKGGLALVGIGAGVYGYKKIVKPAFKAIGGVFKDFKDFRAEKKAERAAAEAEEVDVSEIVESDDVDEDDKKTSKKK